MALFYAQEIYPGNASAAQLAQRHPQCVGPPPSYGAALLLLGPERSQAIPLRRFSIADRCTTHDGLVPQLSESAMAVMPISSLR